MRTMPIAYCDMHCWRFRSSSTTSRISRPEVICGIHILANAIEFPDDYRAVFTLPEKITAMLTTGMIETGKFRLECRQEGSRHHATCRGPRIRRRSRHADLQARTRARRRRGCVSISRWRDTPGARIRSRGRCGAHDPPARGRSAEAGMPRGRTVFAAS